MFLAFKEMLKDKGRFLLIISIVVLISYLVFFLTALAYGLAKDNTTAVERWDAKSVVLKSGTNSNMLSSMMDVEVLDKFGAYEFSPINIGRSVGYINGEEDEKNTIDLVLIGLHQDTRAYPELLEGDLPKTQNEVLASITLKEEEDVRIGDTIVLSMNDQEFKVTGFTEEAKFNVSNVIYTDLEMASAPVLAYTPGEDEALDEQLDREDPRDRPIDGGEEAREGSGEKDEDPTDAAPADYMAPPASDETAAAPEGAAPETAAPEGSPAGTAPDASAAAVPAGPPAAMAGAASVDALTTATPGVPQRISGILMHEDTVLASDDDFDVIPMDDFIQELPGYLAQVLTFGLMIGFLILISTIVLGVFMFIITMQKKQTFGIMKVQGISNGYIARSVIIQTLIVSFVGVVIGLGLTYLTGYFLPYTVPFKSNIAFFAVIGGLIVVISLVGAIFSVRGVSKVDPLEVLE